MEQMLDRLYLERAINRLRAAQPAVEHALSDSVALLAEVYGRMIYFRQRQVALAALTPECQALLARWGDGVADGGDGGGCGVCQ